MASVEFNPKRSLIVRAEHNSDLVQFITKLAEERNIATATFMAIGALKSAKLGFYDQKKHVYRQITITTPHELASCIGNISIKDGKPFIHAHAVLSDEDGNTRAGHLFEGIVFAAEADIQELKGPILERRYDEVTGLSLWDI